MSGPDIVERLLARTKRTLPADWQKGRNCPECGAGADRPKCFFEMGGDCPRHDPDNYEPSPYVLVPDKDCHEAAATITALQAEVERKDAALRNIKYEAERENGRWVHLKRCIAVQVRAALERTKP